MTQCNYYVFIRSLSSSFELCEDLLFMETLDTHTHGKDIFIAVNTLRAGARYIHTWKSA